MSINDLSQRIDRMYDELAEIPQIKRGIAWCHECGTSKQIGASNFQTGWPTCCGYTMSLDSPAERAGR